MKKLLVLIAVMSSAACYTYVPISSLPPQSGKEVRAHLSPAREFDIGDMAVHDVTRVDGVVYVATTETVDLWSSWLLSYQGNRFWSNSRVISLPVSDVRLFEERRLSPLRSAISGAVALVAASVFWGMVVDGGGGNNEGGGGTPVSFSARR